MSTSLIPLYDTPPAPDLTGTPIEEVLQKSKDGFSHYIHELSLRMEVCYEEHSAAILDALIPHLEFELPVGLYLGDLPVDVLTAKTVAMSALTRVNVWLMQHPEQTPLTVFTSLRLFSAAPDCIRFAGHWVRESISLPNELHESIIHCYLVTATFFASLVRTPTRIVPVLASQKAMLDLAIEWWTWVCDGYPVIYPYGRSNPAAKTDPGMAVFRALTLQNPSGMAEAILSGRVCDPRVFVARTMDRLRHSTKLNRMRHLSHLPEATPVLTKECVTIILETTLRLRHCDGGLRELFRKAKAPQAFLDVLLEIRRTRPESSDLPGCSDKECADSMLQMLDLLFNWATCTPTDMIGNLETLVRGGFMVLLTDLAQFAQEQDRKFLSVMDAIMPYALYPKILNALIPALGSPEISPQFAQLKLHGDEGQYLRSLMSSLRPMQRMISDGFQERLCDNLQHGARGADRTSPKSEMICSGCHTVSYCSKTCQSADWKSLHHLECSEMRAKYMMDKAARSHYPYRYRRYHANLTRDRYECNEIIHRTVAYTQDKWRHYDPCGVSQSVIILPGADKDRAPMWFDGLDEYISRTEMEGILPPHLKPRFDAFVSVFRRSVSEERNMPHTPLHLRNGPERFKIPNDGPGAIRFVERSFRWGEREKNVVLLIEQVKEIPIFTGPTPRTAEIRAYNAGEQRSYDGPIFRILSSFVYECTKREFIPIELVNVGASSS